jgi:hypothetical protein
VDPVPIETHLRRAAHEIADQLEMLQLDAQMGNTVGSIRARLMAIAEYAHEGLQALDHYSDTQQFQRYER